MSAVRTCTSLPLNLIATTIFVVLMLLLVVSGPSISTTCSAAEEGEGRRTHSISQSPGGEKEVLAVNEDDGEATQTMTKKLDLVGVLSVKDDEEEKPQNDTPSTPGLMVHQVHNDDEDVQAEARQDSSSPSPTISPLTDSNTEEEEAAASPSEIPPLDYEQWVEDTVKKTILDADQDSQEEGGGRGEQYQEPQGGELYEQEKDHYREHLRRASSAAELKLRQENAPFLAKALGLQSAIDDLDRELGIHRAQLLHKHRVHLSALVAARNKQCRKLPAFWYHALSSPTSGGSPDFFPTPNPLDIEETTILLKEDEVRVSQGKKPLHGGAGASSSQLEEVRLAMDDRKTLISDHEIFANYATNIQCFHIPAEVKSKDREARALLSQSILSGGGRGRKKNRKSAAVVEDLPDWVHRTIVVSSDDEEFDGSDDATTTVLNNIKQTEYLKDETLQTTKEIAPVETAESDVTLPTELQYAIPGESLHHTVGADEERYRLIFQFQKDPITTGKEGGGNNNMIKWLRHKTDQSISFENSLQWEDGEEGGTTLVEEEEKKKKNQKPSKKKKEELVYLSRRRLFPLKTTLLVKDVSVAAAHTFTDIIESVDQETGEPTRKWKNAGLGHGTKLSLLPSESTAADTPDKNNKRKVPRSEPSAFSSILRDRALVNQTLFRIFLNDEEFSALPILDQESTRKQLHSFLQKFCIQSHAANYISGYENDILVRRYEEDAARDRALQAVHEADLMAQAVGYRRSSEQATEDLKDLQVKKEDLDAQTAADM